MKSKTLLARLARLLPAGVPRYVRCYRDDATNSFDKYTVVFTGRAATEKGPDGTRWFPYVGLSGHGSKTHSPCDIDRWGFPPARGRKNHLGKRVPFAEMPEQLQQIALADYREIWRLNA